MLYLYRERPAAMNENTDYLSLLGTGISRVSSDETTDTLSKSPVCPCSWFPSPVLIFFGK